MSVRPVIGCAVLVFYAGIMPAQDFHANLHGQVNGWGIVNFSGPLRSQAGIRFIPVLSLEKKLDETRLFSAEASVNTSGNTVWKGSAYDDGQARIKPYRLWLRYSSSRFELRAGLQKINFGSASLLRPLMWFDRMDPRDPLQLTDGVYGLLGRYYFRSNANIWTWCLWQNRDPKGWDPAMTARNIPEAGGRFEIPFGPGQTAISIHHRMADYAGILPDSLLLGDHTAPEDKLAFDGKWDFGVGLWFEYVVKRNHPVASGIKPWETYLNLGLDYTFAWGNGINIITEYFRYNGSSLLWNTGVHRDLSSLSANYPFGINKLACILYYEWNSHAWYRFINLSRQYDNWTFYLMAFWNPEQFEIYQVSAERNLMAGKGMQLMAVWNF